MYLIMFLMYIRDAKIMVYIPYKYDFSGPKAHSTEYVLNWSDRTCDAPNNSMPNLVKKTSDNNKRN